MATKQTTVDFIADQVQKAGDIRSQKMFGEYALYCDEKVVALICDETLFVKITPLSDKYLDKSHQAPAYPGSKNFLRVPEEKWDDSEWLTAFIKDTASQLERPIKKIKTKK